MHNITSEQVFNKHEYIIRDACMDDIDDICELGHLLNTLNLPANKIELEKVIYKSEQSFSLSNMSSEEKAFLFVLVNKEDRVIGISQIFAKHGTLEYPHLFFEVSYDERYSMTLNKYFRHQVLRLGYNFDGPTEVGSLVLHKNFRSHPEKLGRNLSYVRFLFMAMRPQFFCKRVIAELLPPLGPGFKSALWEAVGRKFTGLDYYEADMLSRENKEFIKSLFPSGSIYVSLLSPEAQEVIGQVGQNSKGAAQLLSKIGFRYSQRVDPFDGGPHFEAEQMEISLIKQTIHGNLESSASIHKEENAYFGLVARFSAERKSKERFRAVLAPYLFNPAKKIIFLHEQTINALAINATSSVSAINLRA